MFSIPKVVRLKVLHKSIKKNYLIFSIPKVVRLKESKKWRLL